MAENDTVIIDLKQKRVIPGLNDSHLHLIRGGLNYNMELRWDGISSLAHAMELVQHAHGLQLNTPTSFTHL